MNVKICLLQLCVLTALLFPSLSFAAAFGIKTHTPELSMNQSNPSQPLPVHFEITNHLPGNSGTINVSNLPRGVIPDLSTGPATDCAVVSTSSQSFKIASLKPQQSCTLKLIVNGTIDLTSTHITISPRLCNGRNHCSSPATAKDMVNVYVIDDFQKVVFIIFENEDPNVALAFPMFKLIADNSVYFDQFHAVARPSQPDYLAMIAGDTFGVTTNNNVNIDATTIVDLLEAKGKTWKAYAENYPTVNTGSPDWENGCYIAAASSDNQYKRKHNPFMSFTPITNDPARCANIVNAQDHFQDDLLNNTLPDYSFFIPNLLNSGHDAGLRASNTWLQNYMYPLMESPQAKDANILFVLMFDESYPKGSPEEVAANHIYAAFYGPMLQSPQIISHEYNFYHLLRTIEDIWQLGTLGRHDDTVHAITPTVWKR